MKPTPALLYSRAAPRPRTATTLRRAIAAAAVIACLSLAALWLAPRLDVAALAGWARGAGARGVAAFALAHVACALLFVPSWPVRIAAGFVYGAAGGAALALLSSFAGCLAAFLAGRRLLRARLAPRIAREPRLAALDVAVERGGLWIVFLLRLSPMLPNELVNYALGASRVRVRDYAAATLAGLVPLTLSFAWFGSILSSLGDLAGGRTAALQGAPGRILSCVGVATTVALAYAGARLARDTLARSLPVHPSGAVPSRAAAAPAVDA